MAARQLLKGKPDHATIGTSQQQWNLPTTGMHGGWQVRIYSASECYYVLPDQAADGGALPAVEYLTVPAGVPQVFTVFGTTFAVAGSTSQTVEVAAL
jgi:hypothetical protein